MTTDFEDALPDLWEGRSEIGLAGGRPHRIYLLEGFFDASADDSAFGGQSRTEIVEGNGQPPKVKRVSGDNVGFGNAVENVFEIGPVTPAFPGGGTNLDDLVGALARGDTRHLLYVGPYAPEAQEGMRLRITSVNADRPLGYIIIAQSEGEALKGY